MSIHVMTPDGKVLSWEERQHIILRKEMIERAYFLYNDLMDRYIKHHSEAVRMKPNMHEPIFIKKPYEEKERGEQ